MRRGQKWLVLLEIHRAVLGPRGRFQLGLIEEDRR